MQYETTSAELSLFLAEGFKNSAFDSLHYYRIDCFGGASESETDRDLAYLHSLYLKLLRRGRRTFLQAEIENLIIETYGPAPNSEGTQVSAELLEEAKEAYNTYQWFAGPERYEIMGNPFDPEHPQNERRLYENLIRWFGPGIASFLHAQVRITDLLPGQGALAFLGQKLDFLLQFPNGRMVVLEPGNHGDPAQQLLDEQRDQVFLNELNTSTIRPRNEEIDSTALQDRLSRGNLAVEGDGFLQPITDLKWAYPFLLPSLIFRMERLLLDLFWNCQYWRKSEVRLLVVERDLACAELGLLSFLAQAEKLFRLHDLVLTPPSLEIGVIEHPSLARRPLTDATDELAKRGVRVLMDVKPEDAHTFDAVLDVSILCSALQCAPGGWGPPTWNVRNSFRHTTAGEMTYPETPRPLQMGAEAEWKLLPFLRDIFRKTYFKDGQLPIIINAFAGKHTIGLLPTGAGKSLCYQMLSMLTPGTTLVVDPVVALITDQVDGLAEQYRIDRCLGWFADAEDPADNPALVRKTIDPADIPALVQKHLIIFISPERFQRQGFRDAMTGLAAAQGFINFAIIDEAHCVSMWGHEFRPSYLQLRRNFDHLQYQGRRPTIVALTGTASQLVLIDLRRILGIDDPDSIIRPATFDRRELHFHVVACPPGQKTGILPEVLQRISQALGVQNCLAEGWGILFSYTPHELWNLMGVLNQGEIGGLENYNPNQHSGVPGLPFGIYTGKHPLGRNGGHAGLATNWAHYKKKIHQVFRQGDIRLMLGNSAFSVGIDNPKVNYVINYRLPQSMEAYYQQCGRAGRGKPAQHSECYLLFTEVNPSRSDRWVRGENLKFPRNEDMSSIAYFQEINFPGEQSDINGVWRALTTIWDATKSGNEVIVPGPEDRDEHYLAQLCVLGIIDDYTISRMKQTTTFHPLINQEIKQAIIGGDAQAYRKAIIDKLHGHLNRYRPTNIAEVLAAVEAAEGETFSEKAIRYWIGFIYREIGYQRRQAAGSMLEYARRGNDPDALRSIVKNYFDRSRFSEKLLRMVSPEVQDFIPLLRDILYPGLDGAIPRGISKYDEAEHVYWETRRLLDERDHPGWRCVNLYADLFNRKTVSAQMATTLIALVEGPQGEAVCKELFQALSQAQSNFGLPGRSLICDACAAAYFIKPKPAFILVDSCLWFDIVLQREARLSVTTRQLRKATDADNP